MMSDFYVRIVKKIYSVLESIKFKQNSASSNENTLLLLRLDSIGDYVLFRNYIQSLKTSEKYKGYKITLCGNLWWKDLAEELDKEYVDDFIWIDYLKMNDYKYRFQKYKEIHFRGFEVLIYPSYSRDLISDSLVAHSGAKEKIGYDGDLNNLTPEQKEKNNLFYSKLIPAGPKYLFEFYRNKDFFGQLLKEEVSILKPQIKQSSVAENKIIICPGAKDAFRRWSPANFAELCSLLKTKFSAEEFVICGSQNDGVFAKEIMQKTNVTVVDYTGKLNLIELTNVMSEAKLVVTNDSGPFHIAVALGKNVVCISNGNNYGRFSPYPKEMNTKSVVIYPDEVLAYPEEERLEKFCKEVKHVDINQIMPAQVLNEINKIIH